MEYVRQFFIIAAISFLGEIMNRFIPLPVPASIYGLIIMLICLMTGIVPLAKVKKTSNFLIQIMPLMFIAPAVGLMDSMNEIKDFFIPFLITVLLSTVLTMGVTGLTAELILKHSKKKGQEKSKCGTLS